MDTVKKIHELCDIDNLTDLTWIRSNLYSRGTTVS